MVDACELKGCVRFTVGINYLAEVPLAASVPVVFLAPFDEEFLPHRRREPFAVYPPSRVKGGCVLIFFKIIDKVLYALGVVLLRAITDLRSVDVSRGETSYRRCRCAVLHSPGPLARATVHFFIGAENKYK